MKCDTRHIITKKIKKLMSPEFKKNTVSSKLNQIGQEANSVDQDATAQALSGSMQFANLTIFIFGILKAVIVSCTIVSVYYCINGFLHQLINAFDCVYLGF